MTKSATEKVVHELTKATAALNEALTIIQTEAPDSVFNHYRRQVAQLMAGVYLDVIKPLVQPYPDLDPGRDEEP
jgi:hypothetical protein